MLQRLCNRLHIGELDGQRELVLDKVRREVLEAQREGRHQVPGAEPEVDDADETVGGPASRPRDPQPVYNEGATSSSPSIYRYVRMCCTE